MGFTMKHQVGVTYLLLLFGLITTTIAATGAAKTACGGVLISERYVLTAASCLHNLSIPRGWSLSGVRLGEYNTSTNSDCQNDVCTDGPITFGVDQQIVHEDYKKTEGLQDDIALVRLSRTVSFHDYIKPIYWQSSGNTGSNLVVIGWGKTDNKSESDVLLKVKVPLVERDKCGQMYKMRLHDGQFCAGGVGRKDSCSGDGGGPAMQWNTQYGRYELVGIVSMGLALCGTPGWPSVYTNVTHYVPWIFGNMKP